jgi:hypothetical protein
MLKLEQIAPYLPYGLKLFWKGSHPSNQNEKQISTLNPGSGDFNKIPDVLRGFNKHATVKLVLRPMSELTNDELRTAMWSIGHSSHIDWTTTEREAVISRYGRKYWIKDIPYAVMEYLFKNHYDVFGLIDAGIAVDINSTETFD